MKQDNFTVDADISKMEHLINDGILEIKSSEYYKQFSLKELLTFMWKYGLYCIPTTEVISFIAGEIKGTAIEIGAGNGSIARTLQIPATDSHMQNLPDVRLLYLLGNQPTINYPKDVEKLDYLAAIKKYKPNTVIGSYITHKYREDLKSGNMYGVQEEDILAKADKYILIGNCKVGAHMDKPIRDLPHRTYQSRHLITRSVHQDGGRIWIWEK